MGSISDAGAGAHPKETKAVPAAQADSSDRLLADAGNDQSRALNEFGAGAVGKLVDASDGVGQWFVDRANDISTGYHNYHVSQQQEAARIQAQSPEEAARQRAVGDAFSAVAALPGEAIDRIRGYVQTRPDLVRSKLANGQLFPIPGIGEGLAQTDILIHGLIDGPLPGAKGTPHAGPAAPPLEVHQPTAQPSAPRDAQAVAAAGQDASRSHAAAAGRPARRVAEANPASRPAAKHLPVLEVHEGDSYWSEARKEVGPKATNAQVDEMMLRLERANGNRALRANTTIHGI